jgi:DNA-binding transcriptional MocR family regulator
LLLPPGADDRAIAERAARRDISVIPLSSCYVSPARARRGLLLGYGTTRTAEITDAIRRLKGVLREDVAL